MRNAYLDLETWSEVPIKDGSHRYSERAEILLWAYALEDGPVEVWDATAGPMPNRLRGILADDRVLLWFHNGGLFDFVVLGATLARYGVPMPAMSRWRDTMVQAYMHGLPGSLDKLCTVLKVPLDQAKLKTGKELVRLFCMPQPANRKLRRATRETHPAEWAKFITYAGADILAMRACLELMPKWNATSREWALWHLDLRTNYRGIAIDLDLVDGAIAAADRARTQLAQRTVELTAGAVTSATQRDLLLAYILAEHGVDLPDMQADTLERRMGDPDLPRGLRELLGVRLQASSTSVAKYRVLKRATSSDGRIRGTQQFRGASRTGREAHRLFQPGNLPRPTLKQHEIDSGIEAIKAGCEDLLYDNPTALLASAVRGAIVAGPGMKLVVADLSNIEGRVAAWLAGEAWKCRAFSQFDAGIGPDLYIVAYAKAFNVPAASVPKKGPERQIGKVMELMLQYQGGVGAFLTGAATYGIDLAQMSEAVLPVLPGDVVEEAEGFHEWTVEQKRSTFGLPRRVFVACDALKRLWRRAHPEIVSYWRELEDTVKEAIANKGVTLQARKLRIRCDGAWLRIVLPSGRALCYPAPRVTPASSKCEACGGTGVVEGATAPLVECKACEGTGRVTHEDAGSITYMGLDQYTRQWKRVGTYGGKLLENITQAVACDQLFYPLPAIEAEGYLPVLSVHDELLCETPDTPEFTAERLAELMCADLGWNEGLPLAAAGYETYRYRKD